MVFGSGFSIAMVDTSSFSESQVIADVFTIDAMVGQTFGSQYGHLDVVYLRGNV